jgi:hypothetical protein
MANVVAGDDANNKWLQVANDQKNNNVSMDQSGSSS